MNFEPARAGGSGSTAVTGSGAVGAGWTVDVGAGAGCGSTGDELIGAAETGCGVSGCGAPVVMEEDSTTSSLTAGCPGPLWIVVTTSVVEVTTPAGAGSGCDETAGSGVAVTSSTGAAMTPSTGAAEARLV